ncbi:alpha-D-ribose 1-methylphosphonate 5-triphosphate synthase subunit PhnG [Desulfacinum hydrothermale DSM 13146]|uniref:Alpha-D-ribose 1-methylphosphonate 5-triphosphate synthase subunit PhnG n=2 Tax=Desulfacinum hydrothermale TaxID=109258 RepID=A0A1W1XIG1_9BACT|nr:alpha-D-ribose 1-methylphosphonate 5-triphosphate synthase subunit PhnG [Desulfacinum hydrothermale DSM 13146]
MNVLAESEPSDLETLWDRYGEKPDYQVVQGPESGLIKVQARIGGKGRRFHVGEITVTRCKVLIPGSAVGTAMVLGCRPRHAEIAAVLDAALQDKRRRSHLLESVVRPLERRLREARRREAARVAATQVNFSTLVRGE